MSFSTIHTSAVVQCCVCELVLLATATGMPAWWPGVCQVRVSFEFQQPQSTHTGSSGPQHDQERLNIRDFPRKAARILESCNSGVAVKPYFSPEKWYNDKFWEDNRKSSLWGTREKDNLYKTHCPWHIWQHCSSIITTTAHRSHPCWAPEVTQSHSSLLGYYFCCCPKKKDACCKRMLA